MIALRRPSVCVVMPAYNAAETLPRAAQSVLEQSYEPLVLAIAVQPGDAKTIAVAEAIEDPRVVVIYRDAKGIANARNSAIRAVRADLYMFLDSDDSHNGEIVQTYVQNHLDHPEPALRYGDWIGVNPRTGRRRVRKVPRPRWKPYEQLLIDNFIATCTVMVDSTILDDVGLFDERYRHAEDWDLWLRIASRYPLVHTGVMASLYRETKKGKIYPRSFFRSEQEIARAQPTAWGWRALALAFAHARYGAYYLRTLGIRECLRQRIDVSLTDLVCLPALAMLKLYRFRRLPM